MNRWNMNLSLNADPLCPGCLAPMLHDTTRFREGIAVCHHCYHRLGIAHLEILRALLTNPDQSRWIASSRGLLFWTPGNTPTPRVAPTLTGSLDPSDERQILNLEQT